MGADETAEEFYDRTVSQLREVTDSISGPLLTKGLGAEHDRTPEGAALQLRRRELEGSAIQALHELVCRRGEWGVVADAVNDAEAWWVYMVLVERAHETLPDQTPRG